MPQRLALCPQGRARQGQNDNSQLVALPRHLILHILSFCDATDLVAVQLTCRRMERLCRKKALWQALCIRDFAWWAEDAVHVARPCTKWKAEYAKLYQFTRGQKKKPRSHNQLDYALRRQKGNTSDARPSCQRCMRPTVNCICDALPSAPINNCACRLVVLQHPYCHVAEGTLRILKCSFRHCDVLVGEDFTSPAVSTTPEYAQLRSLKNYSVLFPHDLAVDVHKAFPRPITSESGRMEGSASSQPTPCCECGLPSDHAIVHLIVVDGSWRHAKAIIRMNPSLVSRASSIIRIDDPPPCIFAAMKTEPEEHCISTAEATAYALATILHGDPHALDDVILPPLRKLVAMQLEYERQSLGGQTPKRAM